VVFRKRKRNSVYLQLFGGLTKTTPTERRYTYLISCCEEARVVLEGLLYQLTEAVKQSQQLLHVLLRVLDKHTPS